MAERFPQLQVDSLQGEQKQVAEKILKFSLNGLHGPFNMLLRSPGATDNILGVSNYLRFGTGVPAWAAELLVLIHARVWGDQYEWDMHVGRAASAGLPAALIEDLKFGREPRQMDAAQAAVFHFCVELLRTRAVRDATFEAAMQVLGEKNLTDVTIMLGQYAMISMILSVSQAAAGRSSLPPVEDPFPLRS